MKDFRTTAKEQTTANKSPIMADKVKVKGRDIVTMYPEGITIYAFDKIKSGNDFLYPVNFKENPNQFFFAPTVLASVLEAWLEGYETTDECSGDLASQGGVKIVLKLGQNKKGQDCIRCEIA